jgi:predicted nicotinamide N-methyase
METDPLDAEAPPVVSYVIPGTASRQQVVHLYGKPFATVERQAHNPNHSVPTGLALWPAGKLVADFLACGRRDDSEEEDDARPASVLELGCGLGLSGLLWHKLHPTARIVLTDCDAETLAYALENCHRNGGGPTLSVETLDWCAEVAPASSSVDTFDLVVASDVIYESTAAILPDLLRTAHSLMTPHRGIFILGLGRRTIALDEVQATAVRMGLEGGDFFVSEFLLDIFGNRLECPPPPPLVASKEDKTTTATDRDVKEEEDDDEGQSLFWAAAVLVFWRKGDDAAQCLAKDMCRRATQRAEEGWLEED